MPDTCSLMYLIAVAVARCFCLAASLHFLLECDV